MRLLLVALLPALAWGKPDLRLPGNFQVETPPPPRDFSCKAVVDQTQLPAVERADELHLRLHGQHVAIRCSRPLDASEKLALSATVFMGAKLLQVVGTVAAAALAPVMEKAVGAFADLVRLGTVPLAAGAAGLGQHYSNSKNRPFDSK